jgi:Zn-dependent metalloprotease
MTVFLQRRFWVATAVFALLTTLISLSSAAPAHWFQSSDQLIDQLSQAAGGQLRVSYHRDTGKVRFLGTTADHAITQDFPNGDTISAETAARTFLQSYGSLFGLQNAQEELVVMKDNVLANGRSFTRFQQVYQGVAVIGAELIVQTNAQHGVVSVNGEILPELALETAAAVGEAEALETAVAKISKAYDIAPSLLVASEPELWIYDPTILGGPGLPFSRLVWRLEVSSTDLDPIRELVLVDAQTGTIALNFNQVAHARNRIHYDNNNNPSLGLPGNGPVRSEGQGPTGVTDVDRAYDYAGDTYNFFVNEHGRDSLDGNGMALISTTRYCPGATSCPFANAFWNGQQMVYGAGFSAADDVVAHELTHGFTEFTSNLFYWFQSGAINESMSDVWGEFVDQTNGAGTDNNSVRWKMGEDVPGFGAIRDMKNPPAFNDPDRMRSPIYVCEQTQLNAVNHDNGGVHQNSGVNNKAAFLMVDGGSFNGFTVTGLGISRVADLYYEAQTNLLTSASDYADLYDALIQASINLGFNSSQRQSVQNALNAVEMNQNPVSCAATEAPVCAPGQIAINLFEDNFESGFANWQADGAALWQAGSFYATSGTNHLWGQDGNGTSDGRIFLNKNVAIASNSFLRFNHAYGFESNTAGSSFFDGGVVEYSTNGGSSWNDAGSLFSHNGYNGTIASNSNPLNGRSAFVADSFGYRSSRLNLSSLAGQNVRFRFRVGNDSSVGDYGWFIDDVRLYNCTTSGGPKDEFNYLPIISKAPAAPTPPPTGTLRIVNNTGGSLRVDVSGLGSHTFPVGTSDWTKLPPGNYSGTLTSLGGPCAGASIAISFSIQANSITEGTFNCSLWQQQPQLQSTLP